MTPRRLRQGMRATLLVVVTTALLVGLLPTSTGAGALTPRAPQAADETSEEQKELDALGTYLAHYSVGTERITAFGPWHTQVWTSTGHLDTSYFRAICNTVAAGALYKAGRPDATIPDISWDRLRAMLVAVMQEYADHPNTPAGPEAQDGWGYGGTPGGALQWDTGFVGYPCTLAAALTWEQLAPSERTLVSSTLHDLASRVYAQRTVSYYTDQPLNCSNSLAEEASADAAFLATASQFYRSDPAIESAWRVRAQDLMQQVAFQQLNPREGCYPPPTGQYTDTVTNHAMYPHPNYGLSVTDNIARALLPWAAQGITLKTNPVGDITDLTSLSGNDQLYGTAPDSPEKTRRIYDANVAYVAVDSDFSLVGRTYHADTPTQTYPDDPITFTERGYLGAWGVSDWAFGADFQNSSFALGAWLYRTYYRPYVLYLPVLLAAAGPTDTTGPEHPVAAVQRSAAPAALDAADTAYLLDTYRALIEHQHTAPGSAYLPARHVAGCGDSAELGAGWSHGYLTTTCDALLQGPLVQYYVTSTLTLSGQVNTHGFLNSFGALNHVVAYLYIRSTPYWPPDAQGNSTLPDLGNPTSRP